MGQFTRVPVWVLGGRIISLPANSAAHKPTANRSLVSLASNHFVQALGAAARKMRNLIGKQGTCDYVMVIKADQLLGEWPLG